MPFISPKFQLEKSENLGNILLKTSDGLLQQVTVTARKPLLEMKADRIIFNADADPTNDVGTGLDVLKKVPFITVDGDENILLKGKSNFKVQLNGKNTGMLARNPKDALRSFPAGLIKRVEVITSPGARYDAEGEGGIINIITTGRVAGINGNVSTGINTLSQSYHNVQARYGGWYNYQAGISKSFFTNKSLRLALLVDQFVERERIWRSSTFDPNFETKSVSYNPARAYRVSASWRFGKLRENVSRKKGIQNSDTKSGGSGSN